MTDAETIAIAGLITTAVVGLFAVVGPMVNARFDRRHGEELARAAARRNRRERAYTEFSAYLERTRLVLLRIEPFLGPVPDPPGPLGDEEWMALSGRPSVSVSPEARHAIEEAHRMSNEFIVKVREYQAARMATGRAALSHPKPGANAGVQMHEARDHALQAIDDAENLMNQELDKI